MRKIFARDFVPAAFDSTEPVSEARYKQLNPPKDPIILGAEKMSRLDEIIQRPDTIETYISTQLLQVCVALSFVVAAATASLFAVYEGAAIEAAWGSWGTSAVIMGCSTVAASGAFVPLKYYRRRLAKLQQDASEATEKKEKSLEAKKLVKINLLESKCARIAIDEAREGFDPRDGWDTWPDLKGVIIATPDNAVIKPSRKAVAGLLEAQAIINFDKEKAAYDGIQPPDPRARWKAERSLRRYAQKYEI
jgi:hypothetical protein